MATEPANSPRPTEFVVPPEQPVQERPVFKRQPAPPPRAERPHRTTQQWLRQQPEEELRQQMEQAHRAEQQVIAQREAQVQMQTQMPSHERVPRNPPPVTVQSELQLRAAPDVHAALREHDPTYRP